MTKAEYMEYKRFAKAACKSEGIKVNIKDMALLETGTGRGKLHFAGNKEMYIDYVMIEDTKSGRQYQCYYSPKNWTREHKNMYWVSEYTK